MPIYCDPSAEYGIVLDSDKDKTNPPTFYYRPLTMSETEMIGTVYDEWMNGKTQPTIKEQMAVVRGSVTTGLLRWENLNDRDGNPIPYDPSLIGDLLTPTEAIQDLLPKIMTASTLSHDDKKKSESQVASEED